jgi:hypothetical protein
LSLKLSVIETYVLQCDQKILQLLKCIVDRDNLVRSVVRLVISLKIC